MYQYKDMAETDIKTSNEVTPRLVDKRGMGKIATLSTRSIAALVAQGMPCLKLGDGKWARVRFDPDACVAWMKQHYEFRRNGKLNGNGSQAATTP
jgi:phage terminase Nu1 subunit (DNA packaging protein)